MLHYNKHQQEKKKKIRKGFCLTTSCLHKRHWSIKGLLKQNNREYSFFDNINRTMNNT